MIQKASTANGRATTLILKFIGMLLISGGLLWDVWQGMMERWTDLGGYAHGPLVVLMYFWAATVAIKRHRDAAADTLSPVTVAALLVGVFVIAFLMTVFEAASFELAAEALLPMVTIVAGFLLFSRELARHLAIAALLLYFTVPIWDPLGEPLRLLTVVVASSFTEWFGWTAHIEGSRIFLPAGVVEIAEGCSGLKYFVAASCLGFFSSFLNNDRLMTTIFVIALFSLSSMIANWIRVTSLVGIGFVTEMQSSLMTSHNFFGWVIFGVFIFPLLILGDRISRRFSRAVHVHA